MLGGCGGWGGYTVKPLHNGHPGTELSGRCREVSIRVKCMDRRTVGTKNPGCCREVAVIELEMAVSGGSTVSP